MKYRLLGSLAALLVAGGALTAVEGAQAAAAPAACDASDAAIYTAVFGNRSG